MKFESRLIVMNPAAGDKDHVCTDTVPPKIECPPSITDNAFVSFCARTFKDFINSSTPVRNFVTLSQYLQYLFCTRNFDQTDYNFLVIFKDTDKGEAYNKKITWTTPTTKL